MIKKKNISKIDIQNVIGGSVYQGVNGKWIASGVDPNGRKYLFTFDTKEQAEYWDKYFLESDNKGIS